MATVLLTGATGFLGQHLLRELRAAGAEVRGLSRSPAGDAAVAALGGVPVRGHLGDAAASADAVFHTAADTSTWSARNAAQTETNVGGTRRLLEAARAAGVGAFVHTSSVSAYSHLVHGTLREDVVQRGGESWINYERTKFLGEQAVRASGLPWLVFQPAHILGPGDRNNWSRLVRLVDQGRLPGAPPGAGNFADVREIAKAQVRAWRDGRRERSYLLGGEQARLLDLIAMMGRQLGRRTPARPTPAWALLGYARLLAGIARLTGKPPEVTPEAATFTCHVLDVDSTRARTELGYRQTPLEPLLADTIAWLRAEGLLRPAD